MKPNSRLEYYKKFYTFGQYGLLSWRQYYGAGSGLSNVQPIRKRNKKMNPALWCRVLQIILCWILQRILRWILQRILCWILQRILCLYFTENTLSLFFIRNTLFIFYKKYFVEFYREYFVSIFYFRDKWRKNIYG